MRQTTVLKRRRTAAAAAAFATTALGGGGGGYYGSCFRGGYNNVLAWHATRNVHIPSSASYFFLTSGSGKLSIGIGNSNKNKLFASSSSSALKSSSSFRAPEPPKSKGESVFPDVEINAATTSEIISKRRNNDPNSVFVVTGANRGIGLQFVRKILKHTKGKIVACCRSPTKATELHELMMAEEESNNSNNRIDILSLDLEDQKSIEEFGSAIKSKYDRIDVLLNVAGLLGDGGQTTPGPERSFSKIDRDWLEKSFSINLFGPVMLTKELVPLMITKKQPSRQKRKVGSSSSGSNEENNSNDDHRRPDASIVANLSARVGSISDNGLGGWYSYRMSKTALNQATRTYANELKRSNVWCVSLHPGTTDTDLSKPFQKNVQKERLFPVDFTVDRLMNVIDSLSVDHSGGFYDWSGKSIPF